MGRTNTGGPISRPGVDSTAGSDQRTQAMRLSHGFEGAVVWNGFCIGGGGGLVGVNWGKWKEENWDRSKGGRGKGRGEGGWRERRIRRVEGGGWVM